MSNYPQVPHSPPHAVRYKLCAYIRISGAGVSSFGPTPRLFESRKKKHFDQCVVTIPSSIDQRRGHKNILYYLNKCKININSRNVVKYIHRRPSIICYSYTAQPTVPNSSIAIIIVRIPAPARSAVVMLLVRRRGRGSAGFDPPPGSPLLVPPASLLTGGST
jgi:hypothetical protein